MRTDSWAEKLQISARNFAHNVHYVQQKTGPHADRAGKRGVFVYGLGRRL